jgi:hypothetical protein
MQHKIAKIAQALFDELGPLPDKDPNTKQKRWDLCMRLAKAALAAMK